VVTLWRPRSDTQHASAQAKAILWLLAALTAIMVMQLLPLPPSIWTALPGRQLYASSAALMNYEQPWRPISLTPDLTIIATLGMLPLWAAGLLGNALLDRAAVRLASAWFLMAIIVVTWLLGLVQVISGPDSIAYYYPVSSRSTATGLLANRNHDALLLSFGIPLLPYLMRRLSVHRGLSVAIALAVLIALLGGILLTGSRAGLLVGVVGLEASVMLFRKSQKGPRRRALAAVAIAVPCMALAGTFIMERFFDIRQAIESDPRFYLAPDFARMAGHFFPWGSGFGSFDPAYRALERPETLSLTFMNHAHDDVLEIVIEGGLAGLLWLIAVVTMFGIHASRLWRASGNEPTLGQVGSVLLLQTGLASVFDYPCRTPLMGALVILAAMWMIIQRNDASARRTVPLRAPRLKLDAFNE